MRENGKPFAATRSALIHRISRGRRGQSADPMVPHFRELVAAKDSPSLWGFRRLRRGSENCAKTGNRQPRLRFGKYPPWTSGDCPRITSKDRGQSAGSDGSPFRTLISDKNSPSLGGFGSSGRPSLVIRNCAKMRNPYPPLGPEKGIR